MDLIALWALLADRARAALAHPVAQCWLLFMAVAALIALLASMPPRRPLSGWFGDFLVRWGLAGLLAWFVVTSLWAVRELAGQRLILPFTPLEGFIEYATVWGVALTGLATFTFFGAVLLLRAIFSREEVPSGVLYYRKEVVMAVRAQVREVSRAAAAQKERREELARVKVRKD
ncbi:MAG: hypothetical protein LM577_06340 [Thermoproteaceae archaeon]|jgi:hypothetical protein|nr:hypothetical protein [Thermoproteaceae archaeon]